MTFSYPLFLLLLLFLIPIAAISAANVRNIFSRSAAFTGNQNLSDKAFLKVVFIGFAEGIAFIFLVIAAAQPSWGKKYAQEESVFTDVAFVIDISRSMTMNDVQPSRLDYAASVVRLLLSEDSQFRYSLTVIKGGAFELVPMTDDREAVRLACGALSPDLTTSIGTDLGESLQNLDTIFPQNMKTEKIVFLLTDGVGGINGRRALCEKWKEQNITVYTVCIGTETEEPLKDRFGSPVLYQNRPVAVPAESADLQIIAAETGGLFFSSEEKTAISQMRRVLLERNGRLEKKSYSAGNRDDSAWFSFAAFLCLGIGYTLRVFLWRKYI